MYLVKKLWLDPMENSMDSAMGYKTVGYVDTIEEVEHINKTCKLISKKECWALQKDVPEFICKKKELKKFKMV